MALPTFKKLICSGLGPGGLREELFQLCSRYAPLVGTNPLCRRGLSIQCLKGAKVTIDPVIDEAPEQWASEGGVEITGAMKEADLVEIMPSSRNVLPFVAWQSGVELGKTKRFGRGGICGEKGIGANTRFTDIGIIQPPIKLEGRLTIELGVGDSLLEVGTNGDAE